MVKATDFAFVVHVLTNTVIKMRMNCYFVKKYLASSRAPGSCLFCCSV